MEKRIRLDSLDNIECLSVNHQKSDFPEHFHETFCISLIRKGVESIKMKDQTFFGEAGSITLTNPFEIHANPILDKEVSVSFDTIYLSQDLVDHYLGSRNNSFLPHQINDPSLTDFFLLVRKSLNTGSHQDLLTYLREFLLRLHAFSSLALTKGSFSFSAIWSEIILYIDHHIEEKINLDMMAQFANQDKFAFAKNFKAKFGMSPINYVLMKKVFKAKTYILPETELTQLAYQFNFSDQAHFSKTFKRFVGVSPLEYKRQLRSSA